MLYELPSSASASAWPEGIGYICAQSEKDLHMPIPVLPGINVLTLGVVGTGKTSSYTLPAADILLKKQPETKAVFFEIKHSFIDHFMGPKDKVITASCQWIFSSSAVYPLSHQRNQASR